MNFEKPYLQLVKYNIDRNCGWTNRKLFQQLLIIYNKICVLNVSDVGLNGVCRMLIVIPYIYSFTCAT